MDATNMHVITAVITLLCKMESLSLPEDIDYDDGEVKTNSLIHL